MRVQCDQCGASYNIPDEKIQGRPFKITCKRCKNVIRVRPGDAGGRKTMEVAAADVQPRMTGEMRAASSDNVDEMARTVFQPGGVAQVRSEPAKPVKAEVANTQSVAAQDDTRKPRLTIEGKALDEQVVTGQAFWYLAYSRNKRGPWTLQQIEEHLKTVSLQGDIFVWKAGFDNWKKIQDVSDFAEIVARLNKPAATPAAPVPPREEPKPVEKSKPRKTFTELIQSELNGEEKKADGEQKTSKIDLGDLVKTRVKEQESDKTAKQQKQPMSGVKLEEYRPPEKKKIPWIPITILLVLFLLVTGTPLVLAYKQIIEIPGLDQAPVIGHYFKKEEVDHYAELRAQWEMLIKIDEAKVALKATKQEEEKQRLEQERQKALEEQRARQRRAEERRRQYASRGGSGGGSNGSQGVTEFDFSEGSDGTEMDTIGELRTTDVDRNEPLTQSQVNKVIRANMGQIAACVKAQKKYGQLNGSMEVRFTVSRRGSVVRANIVTPKFKDSYVGDCVSATIERIRFPRSGGSVTVSYPFQVK